MSKGKYGILYRGECSDSLAIFSEEGKIENFIQVDASPEFRDIDIDELCFVAVEFEEGKEECSISKLCSGFVKLRMDKDKNSKFTIRNLPAEALKEIFNELYPLFIQETKCNLV